MALIVVSPQRVICFAVNRSSDLLETGFQIAQDMEIYWLVKVYAGRFQIGIAFKRFEIELTRKIPT